MLSWSEYGQELAVQAVCLLVTQLNAGLRFASFEVLLSSTCFAVALGIAFLPAGKWITRSVAGLLALLGLVLAVIAACPSLVDPAKDPSPFPYKSVSPDAERLPSMPPLLGPGESLHTEGPWFKDQAGRVLLLRGVNLGGISKLPADPDSPTWKRSAHFFSGSREVSFVGRPFPLEEAEEHFARLRAWGLTFVRFLVTWEAIEHDGPGQYDQAYLDYVVAVVRKAHAFGIVVFVDPHQDVWSRWTGGSGAPAWTLEAVGFDVARMEAAGAAVTHQGLGDPLPKMIWGSNNWRLGTATMFTLFFAGNQYAPNTEVDGEPAQEWLQRHFIDAVATVARALKDEPNVVGFDTLNEPNNGWVGRTNLASRTDGLAFRWGWNMSPWEHIMAGAGFGQRYVDLYNPPFVFERTDLVNPNDVSAWREGPTGCVWRREGVWDVDPETNLPRLLRPDHFKMEGPGTFVDRFMVPFWRKLEDKVRSVTATAERREPWLVLAEPPIDFSDPAKHAVPSIGSSHEGAPLKNYVYAPHWYEIVILLTKTFRTWIGLGEWRWDWTLSRFTGAGPVIGPLLGKRNLVASYAHTLRHLRQVGQDMDEGRGVPTVIGETGIPFDLDGGAAFKSGDFSKQVAALDIILGALDASLLSFTLWNYTPQNTNARGDLWNDEDLSLFSKDQRNPASADPVYNGGRALPALVRPYARKVSGVPTSMDFDMSSREFHCRFASANTGGQPTEIFVPQYQYPKGVVVEAAGCRYEHDEDEQTLRVWPETVGSTIDVFVRPRWGERPLQ